MLCQAANLYYEIIIYGHVWIYMVHDVIIIIIKNERQRHVIKKTSRYMSLIKIHNIIER